MSATDIVAYTYQAEILCRPCMRNKAAIVNEANGTNSEFVPVETLLDNWARWAGIDREDEHSFDSDDFPKVVFECHTMTPNETCTNCGEELL